MTRAERNKAIDAELVELAALRGVTTAAVVDADGFVTHIRRDFELDTDALGAAVQLISTAAHRATEQVAQEETRLLLIENKLGSLLLAPLAQGFVLAAVADDSAMLGTVRYEVKASVQQLNRLLGG